MQGNLLEENANGKKRRYGYNPFGQQTEVKEDNFKLENFYDGEFLRAKTSVNGEISRFLYYNGELQAETYDNDTVKTRYLLGYGIAGSETEGRDGFHAYHLDEQNSTAYITGNQRTIENFYEYDAFGGIRQHSEEVKNRILYTGQQYDQETGQYYLRARFYNPVVGRFMQEDVYRGDGLNLYAYCGNNPVVYYDPSGYEGEKCKIKGGGILKLMVLGLAVLRLLIQM
ncbi:RHS repeat-associated core domain-containing protein [Lacrimispora sinapis]|uniref:RHS repeat-associated core domain-containing protein n=1 Tax=Lacrimispora sinapis TaxID=3111456 RepID=UPI0039F55E14